MKIRSLLLAAIPALFALQLTGCGDPPQPVETPKPAPKLEPKPVADPARVSGTIVFEGAAFDAPTGTLYVSVYPKGSPMPLFSHQYLLQGDVFQKSAAGAKSLTFDVGAQNFIGQGAKPTEAPPVECDVRAKYKESVDVMSKTLAEATAVYQAGKSDYVLTLKLP